MAELKEKLRADLTAAIKRRDTAVVGPLRMALAAVRTEEVSGKQERELSDEEVRKVLTREVRKRGESAEAFRSAGRGDRAEVEAAESEVLRAYLPAQLEDTELSELVRSAVAEVAEQLGAKPGPKQMGQVMKAANAKVAGRAEGARVAAAVKTELQ
jgi:uncharacterized protein YqeY